MLSKLPVEVRIVVGGHAALEGLCISCPIEEPRGDAQRTNLIAGRPCSTNLVGFRFHVPPSDGCSPIESCDQGCALAEISNQLEKGPAASCGRSLGNESRTPRPCGVLLLRPNPLNRQGRHVPRFAARLLHSLGEAELPKLHTRVRFPSPAPILRDPLFSRPVASLASHTSAHCRSRLW
jgi:hypothetical protein